jgi:hypothetical protein
MALQTGVDHRAYSYKSILFCLYHFSITELKTNLDSLTTKLLTQKANMKYKAIIITMSVAAASLFASKTFAQDNTMSQVQRDHQDSVQTAKVTEARLETTKDENRMADAKLDRKQTKAKAKNAQRVRE